MADEPLLQVRELRTHFFTRQGVVRAVDGVSFDLRAGDALGLVGESGCGKSVTARSLIRLVERPGRIVGGEVRFQGRDLLALDERALRRIRGRDITMVFQDPMSSLNPVLSIADQVTEVYRVHEERINENQVFWDEVARTLVPALPPRSRRYFDDCLEMLRSVQLPAPEVRAYGYPHQLSGGQRQRVMLAIALACQPSLLIADEATTALDVTVQAQIMALLSDLRRQTGMAMLVITHNLGLVAEFCNRVAVMYAGHIVEEASVDDLFTRPQHPYTQGLLRSLPSVDASVEWLTPIEGEVPDPINLPAGCHFAPRCPRVMDVCRVEYPRARPAPATTDHHEVSCHLY
jgi:oligopeptide/dipeptide ABC transporter ATP-binding protein